jgi:LAGLIDADG endonuclease.
MKETDIAYIAGLIDGEGYIGIKKDRGYQCQERKTPGYHARIAIHMVDEQAIKFIAETLGGWYYKENHPRHRGGHFTNTLHPTKERRRY